ncbi:MAG: GerMN domain-containing protein [bacterium]|nr:GerMN domain-containing protein [bacterium]
MRKYGGKATIVVTVMIAAVVAAAVYGGFRYNKVIRDRLAALTQKLDAEEEPGTDVYTAEIYFADEQYEKLVPEKRELKKPEEPEDQVRLVVTELIKGPDADENARTLPKRTGLLSVFIKDGIALLNFDEQITSEKYGTTGELFLINSLYKTVTENVEGVKGVQILVEGSNGPTVYGDEGHLYTGIPRCRVMGKKSPG